MQAKILKRLTMNFQPPPHPRKKYWRDIRLELNRVVGGGVELLRGRCTILVKK